MIYEPNIIEQGGALSSMGFFLMSRELFSGIDACILLNITISKIGFLVGNNKPNI